MILDKYYQILQVDKSTSLDEIKRSYRRLAFALHPDLNPTIDTTTQFQQLNEAYVTLLRLHQANASNPQSTKTTKQSTTTTTTTNTNTNNNNNNVTQQQKKEQDKAYRKNKTEYIKGNTKKTHSNNSNKDSTIEASINEEFDEKQKILQDILNDDFARNVFEDIFRTIRHQQAQEPTTQKSSQNKKQSVIKRLFQTIGQITNTSSKEQPPDTAPPNNLKVTYAKRDTTSTVKSWLKSQIDDEQIIELPSTTLRPGARIRLNIRQGFSEEVRTIELTLPPDFTYNKQLYFKGMGKKLGRWYGDLYLRFVPKQS